MRDFSYDDRVSIIGYCIGQAIPTPGTKILNEKWLILKSGLVTPAAYVRSVVMSGMHSSPVRGKAVKSAVRIRSD